MGDWVSIVVAVASLVLSIAGVIALPIGAHAREQIRRHELKLDKELFELRIRLDELRDLIKERIS